MTIRSKSPSVEFTFVLVCRASVRALPLILALSVLTALAVAQSVSANADRSVGAIRDFATASGWQNVAAVQTAVANGTIDNGDGIAHAITLKIDRQGRFRSEIPDLEVLMVATVNGGAARAKGKGNGLSVSQGSQLSSSALLPIFLPLVEVGRANVRTGIAKETQATTTVSLAKVWTQGDGLDAKRSRSGLLQATFDNTTHLLTSVSYDLARAKRIPC
jgi:hypothetical protein